MNITPLRAKLRPSQISQATRLKRNHKFYTLQEPSNSQQQTLQMLSDPIVI